VTIVETGSDDAIVTHTHTQREREREREREAMVLKEGVKERVIFYHT
jgi:hypothetical protein